MSPTVSYEKVGSEIGRLVDLKQRQYGDSFHWSADVLRILYPDGVQPTDYQNLMAVIRVLDKLFRVANGDQGDESAWSDIAGYGLLGSVISTDTMSGSYSENDP